MRIARNSRVVCHLRFDYESDYSLIWNWIHVWSDRRRDELGRLRGLPLPVFWPKIYWIDPDTRKIHSLRERRRIFNSLARRQLIDNRR